MATAITIRNLDDSVKQLLRVRAAEHGRSMEAEVREILIDAVRQEPGVPPKKLDDLIGVWKNRLTTDEVLAMTRGE